MAVPVHTRIYPTADAYDNSLLYGGWRWSSGAGTTVITYCFSNKYAQWTAVEKNAFRAALRSYSDVLNVKFVEVATEAKASWVEYTVRTNQVAGITANTTGVHGGPSYAADGHNPVLGHNNKAYGYFNRDDYAPTGHTYNPAGLKIGGFGYNTYVHEIGHALGLAHPFAPNYGYQTFYGVNKPTDLGYYNLNQGIYTVMSYNYGWKSVFDPAWHRVVASGYDGGPMAFDIHALQRLYGPNTTSGGNSTYTLSDTLTYWKTLYDFGGIDTIVYNGTLDTRISLNTVRHPAGIAGAEFTDNLVTEVLGHNGGLMIARDVVIERAIGGSGKDRIWGNEASNEIYGRDGDDVILDRGSGGHLYGGNGNDTIQLFSAGDDTHSYFAWLYGGEGDDALLGTGELYGENGNDLLFGSGYVDGGAGNDKLDSTINWGGDATLVGGPGDDSLTGGTSNTVFIGGPGRDTMRGVGTFVYKDLSDSIPDNFDVVISETSTNRINLSSIDANVNVAGDQPFVFHSAGGLPESAGDICFIYENGLLYVAAKVDDGPTIDFKIQLPASSPNEAMFIL